MGDFFHIAHAYHLGFVDVPCGVMTIDLFFTYICELK